MTQYVNSWCHVNTLTCEQTLRWVCWWSRMRFPCGPEPERPCHVTAWARRVGRCRWRCGGLGAVPRGRCCGWRCRGESGCSRVSCCWCCELMERWREPWTRSCTHTTGSHLLIFKWKCPENSFEKSEVKAHLTGWRSPVPLVFSVVLDGWQRWFGRMAWRGHGLDVTRASRRRRWGRSGRHWRRTTGWGWHLSQTDKMADIISFNFVLLAYIQLPYLNINS